MRVSRYYIWAIHDVEDWSSRPAVTGARIQEVLRRIEARALEQAGIDPANVGRQSTGDGAVLALPGDIPKELVTTKYVQALCEAVEEHDAQCPAAETIRLRLALHAGESPVGGTEWAGPGVVVASRLLDSAVLRRVLAAAIGSPLALIVSSDWYRAVIKEGYARAEGYQEVWVETRRFSDFAWVRVPGRTRPPGLLPEDDPEPHRGTGPGRPGPRAASPQDPGPGAPRLRNQGTIGTFGDFSGATINGDVALGNSYHDAPGARRRGGER